MSRSTPSRQPRRVAPCDHASAPRLSRAGVSSYTDSEEDAKDKAVARNQPSPSDGTRRPSDPAREYRPQQQKKDNHHHHLSKHLSKTPPPHALHVCHEFRSYGVCIRIMWTSTGWLSDQSGQTAQMQYGGGVPYEPWIIARWAGWGRCDSWNAETPSAVCRAWMYEPVVSMSPNGSQRCGEADRASEAVSSWSP